MTAGWRYRAVSVLGSGAVASLAVLVANRPLPQRLLTTHVPWVNNLSPVVLGRPRLTLALLVSVSVVLGSLVPLYKPRPRRILDTVFLVEKRVLVAVFALATVGYFKWSHRLPRSTLILIAVLLAVGLPAWFVLIRRRPAGTDGRAIVVGDDPVEIGDVIAETDLPVVGYVAPPSPYDVGASAERRTEMVADGGADAAGAHVGAVRDDERDDEAEHAEGNGAGDGIPADRFDDVAYLGGLSRLEDTLVEYDVDTAVLAFAHPDRAEFFGALDACHEHGVAAMAHRNHADSLLTTAATGAGDLVEIDLEPWDWLDYAFKRAFDVAFAIAGLLALLPAMVVIAAAIRLDSAGPVLYSQRRTAEFGDTFAVYKFRSMVVEGESATPVDDGENGRITRVGRVLRRTHLDEIPQLWAILTGQMSVVGPRAIWTDEEHLLEETTEMWRKRWFVRPGLTGLAQINDAKSTDPQEKLRYDLEYIRRQSFWFDLKIVMRQLWMVVADVERLVTRNRKS